MTSIVMCIQQSPARAEYVADCDSFWQRTGIDQVKSCRDRLYQAQPWRRREAGAPNMTNHDLGVSQQRGKLLYIASFSRMFVSRGVFTLERICGAMVAAKRPRNRVFILAFSSSISPSDAEDRHSFCNDMQPGR
jgi:hypothetical protein